MKYIEMIERLYYTRHMLRQRECCPAACWALSFRDSPFDARYDILYIVFSSSSGLTGERAADARRQQMRRDGRSRAVHQRRRGAGEKVAVALYGDVRQDEPQRQRALPGTTLFYYH